MTGEELAVIRERMRTDFSSTLPPSRSEEPIEQAVAPPGPIAPVPHTPKDDPGEPASDWA